MDYFSIIEKYYNDNPELKRIYLIHVTLVTKKALEIAKRLKLNDDQLRFIEEASMLHDIGIFKVNAPEINAKGKSEYIEHGYIGREIIEKEGFPKHALVCERHTGVGITIEKIKEQNLPLPLRDMSPQTLEEEIISYADLFYSKNPNYLFIEKDIEIIKNNQKKYGENDLRILESWIEKYEVN